MPTGKHCGLDVLCLAHRRAKETTQPLSQIARNKRAKSSSKGAIEKQIRPAFGLF
jgi:hypothetical protein